MEDSHNTFPADFTPERMHLVGAALAAARDSAQDAAQFELGDDAWCIGCVAYRRSCSALVHLSGQTDWLAVLNPGMEFQFKVGVVPVRFYHGDSEAPSARHSQAMGVETQMVAFDEPAIYRLAVETNERGLTNSVSLIQLLNKDVTGNRTIWTRTTVAVPRKPEGMELAPPAVQHLDDEAAANEERATGTGDDS